MKYKLKCDYCGAEITKRNSHGNRNKHHFCNSACANKYKNKKQKVACDVCGRKFHKKSSDIMRTSHNFCCQECSIGFHRWSGTKSNNVKVGGKLIHRSIVERLIGRTLLPNEEIHHIDFNHQNNDTQNLVILSKSEHSKIHAARKERDANGKFI